MSEARCYLDPRQVGVGVPVGAEAIIHSIRSIFECSSILPNNKWCLPLDFANAINCTSCLRMLDYMSRPALLA